MLHRSIRFLLENKIFALLLLIVFTGWGISNAPFNWETGLWLRDPVAVDAIPDIGENQQIVFTRWDGRSPQDIEDQITYPLTSALMGIPGVKTVRSSSMFGFSSIYVIFDENIEFYWSRSRILEKLNSLPAGVLPEGVAPTLGPDATALGQIFWYTLEGRDPEGNVTGGWDLHELRSVQDFYVKYALASARGVSEVASVGGHVKEYQIDVDPELMRQYNIALPQVVKAVKSTNRDIGAQTIEINQVEYMVRGLGYVKSIKDIENAVVTSHDYTAIRIKDIARVNLAPAPRRGILDKEGAEVAGGVVVARYGANPMQVIEQVKEKIAEISPGLPVKTLKDGRVSQLTIVPFYDRTQLITETLDTLNEALTMEILVTILVIVIMLFNLRASLLISGLLPVAVLMVFISMKLFRVDANIVALSGIAIAIGTMVDVGVILTENILRHLEKEEKPVLNTLVYKATTEVSGAIITAVLTTIISFIPVFTMTGAEGKLFRPLAFTKTMALVASILVTLFLIPPFAAVLLKKRKRGFYFRFIFNGILIAAGITFLFMGVLLGWALVAFGTTGVLSALKKWPQTRSRYITMAICVVTILCILAIHWRPLGFTEGIMPNLIFVSVICLGLLGLLGLFKKYYASMLMWTLRHKLLFLSVPVAVIILGVFIMRNTGKEFMPALNEGSFLLMPSSLPHSGVEENKRILKQLDMAVANIPEIKTVVGKAGRVASALDPAPLSMYENVILYKPEFIQNENGEPLRFKVDKKGAFVLPSGKVSRAGNAVNASDLIEDPDGEYYRNWRPHINSPDDIWQEILKATQLPGITSSPKLQPIQTRLIMLQTGMRAPMGIKIKGQDLEQIETFGFQLENLLKDVEGIKKEAVFAERIVGKPYLVINIDRDKAARYGVQINDIQEILEIAVGGKVLSYTVEGRERYGIRVRYPRELRNDPENLQNVYVPVGNGHTVPLSELANIHYEQGPQVIKSEDTFPTGYVLFDKLDQYAEVDVVQNARQLLKEKRDSGELIVPPGISYTFTGTYENQLHAEKTLSIVIPLSLLIIFLILYVQFRSVSISFMVFAGIAVAFGGGFIMMGLYSQEWFMDFHFFGTHIRELFQIKTINLSVAVWVGFIALFGIATDDGVVMATYLRQTFARNLPKSVNDIRATVLEAGQKRIRPCLMTTATTLLALLPVLTSRGKGSDVMIPMAIPVFGGMFMALITLFVMPVLFCWKAELSAVLPSPNKKAKPKHN